MIYRPLSIALCLMMASAMLTAVHAAEQPLDRVIAVVNDNVITAVDLEAEMKRIKEQLRLQNTAIPAEEVLKKQLVERMIMREIQLQLADRTRIRVDDETLNRAIDTIAAQNNMTLEAFRSALAREGMEFAAFREQMRKEIIISRLQKREVNDRVTVTKQEIDDFLANQSQRDDPDTEYRLGHILVVVPEAASSEQINQARARAEAIVRRLRDGEDFAKTAVAESDAQQALEGGDLGWRKAQSLPTLFADKVASMTGQQISDPIRSPSGFHIIKLLDKRVNAPVHMVTQTRARHILISNNDFNTPEQASNRVRQLRDRIEAGENFADLARAYSSDPGSAAQGGDLGWVDPGTMVPAFEQAMNALQPNQLSEAVSSPFGWHLIQVLERRTQDKTETVERNKAQELIRARKVEPALQAWLRRLRDEAFVEIRL